MRKNRKFGFIVYSVMADVGIGPYGGDFNRTINEKQLLCNRNAALSGRRLTVF